MKIIGVRFVNYDVPNEVYYKAFFTDKEKALSYIDQEIKRITPIKVSGLLLPNRAIGRVWERIEYISKFGHYNCAYELVPINVR